MSQVINAFKGATSYDIVAWHRPIVSGIVFGSIVTVWFIFVYFEYTLATFLCRAIQLLFVLGAVPMLTQRALVSASDVTANMDKVYEAIRPCTQKAVQQTFDILTWRDFNKSAKAFLVSFLIAYIGNYVNDSTLFIVVVVAVFSIPVVYEKKKPEIDAQVVKVQGLVDKYLGMLKTKGAAAKGRIHETKEEAEAEFASRKNQ